MMAVIAAAVIGVAGLWVYAERTRRRTRRVLHWLQSEHRWVSTSEAYVMFGQSASSHLRWLQITGRAYRRVDRSPETRRHRHGHARITYRAAPPAAGTEAKSGR